MMKAKARRRSNLGPKRSPFKTHRASPLRKRKIEDFDQDGAADPMVANAGPVPANIRVAVRVRPENEREMANSLHRNVIDVIDDRMLVFDPKACEDDFFFHGQKQQRRDLNKKANRDQKFAFDCVFGPNSTNEDVFEGTTKDLIDVIFNGYNCSVFVYGATGAGKTHTMLGSESNTGIIFRTVMELYDRIGQVSQDTECEVVISYLEVYNETIIDLINPGTKLDIREDGKMGVNIPGLSSHRPSGPDDLLRLLQYGNGNRSQHPTDANKESSRSHAVFQVYIKQTNRDSGLSADVKVAKLSMIDLAGSERGSATSSRGAARFREGANINKSLLALGNCINALAEGSKYIPYRNSKLTRLLKDSIGGNCRTVMISNVSPSSLTYEDTFNTLRYADRAKKIKIKLKKNVLSVDFQVSQYAKIVEDLKKQLDTIKAKVSALEEENLALKNQIEFDDGQRKQSASISENMEEMKHLKEQLADLEERQKDYDDLQKRIAEFEAREKVAKLESDIRNSTVEETSGKIQDSIDNYLQVLRKFYQLEGQIRLLKLKQESYQHSLMRSRLLSFDEDEDETSQNRLVKFVRALDKTMLRLKKQTNAMELSLKILENEVPMNDTGFLRKIQNLKTEMQSEHSLKVNEFIFHDQAHTEDLFRDSMVQLKKLYLRCFTSNMLDSETKEAFEGLVSKVSCQKIQFRDHKITENNEQSNFDRCGSFYSNILNLEFPMEVNNYNMNETMAADKEAELIVTVENMDDASDEENGDDDFASPVRWRPPTPPKADPSSNENTPASPSKRTVSRENVTPPLPQLNTVEIKQLLKPPNHNLDCTYDVACNETFDINAVASFDANDHQARALDETFEPKKEVKLFESPIIKEEPELDGTFEAKKEVKLFESPIIKDEVELDETFEVPIAKEIVSEGYHSKETIFEPLLKKTMFRDVQAVTSLNVEGSDTENFCPNDAKKEDTETGNESTKDDEVSLSVSGIEPLDHDPVLESTIVISTHDQQPESSVNSAFDINAVASVDANNHQARALDETFEAKKEVKLFKSPIIKEEPELDETFEAKREVKLFESPIKKKELKVFDETKVARVSPMGIEKPKNKLPLSATVVDRRPKNVQQGLQRATLKRQPGVKSTSNLLHALENMGPKPKPIHEAPAELVSSGSNLSTPSYLKPTSASARKFRGVQAGTPNQNENHPKQTGAFPKKNRTQAIKEPSSTTLRPLNK